MIIKEWQPLCLVTAVAGAAASSASNDALLYPLGSQMTFFRQAPSHHCSAHLSLTAATSLLFVYCFLEPPSIILSFIHSLSQYFSTPLQVCKLWCHLLYDDSRYWQNLTFVIYYNQFRQSCLTAEETVPGSTSHSLQTVPSTSSNINRITHVVHVLS